MAPNVWMPSEVLHGLRSECPGKGDTLAPLPKNVLRIDQWPATHPAPSPVMGGLTARDICSPSSHESDSESVTSFPAVTRADPKQASHDCMFERGWPGSSFPTSTISTPQSKTLSRQSYTPNSIPGSPQIQGEGEPHDFVDLLFMEALKEMSWVLCCEYQGVGMDTLVAVESIFNIDSVLAWLPHMGNGLAPDSSQQPIEALTAMLANLCTLRTHIEAQATGMDVATMGPSVPLNHMYSYLHRFNRLSKARCLEASWLLDWEGDLQTQLEANGIKPEQILKEFVASPLQIIDQ